MYKFNPFTKKFDETYTGVELANLYGGEGSGGNFTLSSTTHATKGKIYFGTEVWFDEANTRLFFNTASPANSTNEVYIGDGGRLALARHSDAAGSGPTIRGYRSRGTEASLAAPQLDDYLFTFAAYGYTGTSWSQVAGVAFKAAENWGASIGTYITFFLRETGTTTQQDVLQLNGDMNVGINSGLHVGTLVGTAGDNNLLVDGTIKSIGAFGCNNATPQTAYASGGALNAYATGAYGLDSAANMSALHAMVVSIRAALVANGIMS